jgi:hypothetical protein
MTRVARRLEQSRVLIAQGKKRRHAHAQAVRRYEVMEATVKPETIA